MLRPLIRAAASLALVLLAACATLPQPAVDRSDVAGRWQTHRDALSAITQFALDGRAASGVGLKADLRWKQFGDGRFETRIAGPFGAGAVAISGTPHDVEIRTKDGTERTRDPQAWLQQHAGWTFPVDGLRWWALGLPSPDSPAQLSFDAQGRLASLTQDGWTLQYDEYQDVQGLDLPRRFEAASARITLKLIIDRWHDIETSRDPLAPT